MAYRVSSKSYVRSRSLFATLAPFSVACFLLTLATDLAYWATTGFVWETMSVWLLTAGLIVAALTVIAGLIDLVRSRTHSGLGQPWLAIIGYFVAVGLSILNVFVHSRDGYTAVVPEGLALSFIVALVLFTTTIAGRSMSARSVAEI